MAELVDRARNTLARSWQVRITIIYLLSRLLSIGLMLLFAQLQGVSSYTAAHPDYISFANFWDARWYAYIAGAGYPSELPIDQTGHVMQNAWAFLPVYPMLVGGFAAVTHLSWSVVAVVVSLLSGWGFVLVAYLLFRDRLNSRQSTWAVVFIVVAPASPILGVAYAESFFLLLLATALYFLVKRQYLLLAILLPFLAFTRPGAIALALAIGAHWLVRWWHRRTEPFPIGTQLGVAVLAGWAALLGFAWMFVAAAVTGVPNAYIATELSWRAAYIGWVELIPGTGWFQAANWWFGQPWTIIVPIVAIAALVTLLVIPAGRRLGSDLRAWVASFGLYLFLVFFPQSSSMRMLAPMFPLAGIFAQIRSLPLKLALALLFVGGQVWWLFTCWTVIGSDWTPP